MEMEPLISVILASKNEENNIERCLLSLKAQTYKNFEIILVDACSSDHTQELAKKHISQVYDISSLNTSTVSNIRGLQVNYGVSKSKGSILFFPDVDMTHDKTLLAEIAAKLTKENLDALYIPEEIIGHGFFGKVRNFERSFYNMTPIDALRVVRKNLYTNIGGFDEKNVAFGPDDWDLTKSIKKATAKLGITTPKVYHHEESLTLTTYIKKKAKYTSTFEGYIQKWGSADKDVHRQFSPFYRFFGVFVENGKWKKLVSSPLLTLGMSSLRFSVGFLYLFSKFRDGGS